MNSNIRTTLTGAPDLNVSYQQAINLLSNLIATPSISGEENTTGDIIETFLQQQGVNTFRKYNNIWCYNENWVEDKPTILLNSHHDTVRPNGQYTRDPFQPEIVEDKLFGLGSNDAGGPLVSLISTFLYFFEREDLPFNLCLAATAEEETSGELGIRTILKELKPIAFAIVGEPTGMDMAITEKGSMVLDCSAKGRAGHAAREEGDNAIYHALKDIEWFKSYQFPIMDGAPQPVKMSVTEIGAGIQHNIVPAECHFTVDIRFDHNYTEKEIINTIINHTSSYFKIRANVLKPSHINITHPVVVSGLSLGRKTYFSPTSSDQGWLEMPSVKIGPGDSARSHSANEYIGIDEIEAGINTYIGILESLDLTEQKPVPSFEAFPEVNPG